MQNLMHDFQEPQERIRAIHSLGARLTQEGQVPAVACMLAMHVYGCGATGGVNACSVH
jgi:hypothetical protein